MTKGHLPDPNREKRGTGHRPLPGKAKPVEIVPAYGFDLSPPESIPADAHEIWHGACSELIGKGLCRRQAGARFLAPPLRERRLGAFAGRRLSR